MNTKAFTDDVRFQAYGQAAYMLIEGFLLDLVETKALSAERATDTVNTIVETKRQMLSDGTEDEVATCSIGMLITLANSLRAAEVSVELEKKTP